MRKIRKIKKKDLITEEDINFWESFKKQDNISFEDKDRSISQSFVEFKFDLKLDLHGLTLHQAFGKVDEIFDLSKKKNLINILLITGKGLRSKVFEDPYKSDDLSLLRYAIPDYIKKNYHNRIISISKASNENGGDGAYELKLKKTIR